MHHAAASRTIPAAVVGGGSLIAASLLFIGAFSYLAAKFDYPDVLARDATEVLPRLLALGAAGRAVWSAYALIPLLLVPAGVGVVAALGRHATGAAQAALAFASLSAASMTLGLLRWPSIQWELAGRFVRGTESERAAITPLYAGLNSYLGVFLGEFVGELCLNLFFALTAYAWLRSPGRSRALGWAILAASGIGLLAMFRNATAAVEPFAVANNAILPIALIALGVAIARTRPEPGGGQIDGGSIPSSRR